jgi:putative solute:sodium symporter small subunit
VRLSEDRTTKGSDMTPENRAAYWRANLRLVAFCLAAWFVCSYGFGILLVEELNRIRIGGFKLGFWFAQQGSIYIFVLLIFFYAWRMNRLDRKHDVHED